MTVTQSEKASRFRAQVSLYKRYLRSLLWFQNRHAILPWPCSCGTCHSSLFYKHARYD
jgi:hypothetical protein